MPFKKQHFEAYVLPSPAPNELNFPVIHVGLFFISCAPNPTQDTPLQESTKNTQKKTRETLLWPTERWTGVCAGQLQRSWG